MGPGFWHPVEWAGTMDWVCTRFEYWKLLGRGSSGANDDRSLHHCTLAVLAEIFWSSLSHAQLGPDVGLTSTGAEHRRPHTTSIRELAWLRKYPKVVRQIRVSGDHQLCRVSPIWCTCKCLGQPSPSRVRCKLINHGPNRFRFIIIPGWTLIEEYWKGALDYYWRC